jgi:HEAT repeat protein
LPSSTPSTAEPEPLDPEVVARRRVVAVAGHTGDAACARRALADPAPAVRATALGALARLDRLEEADLRAAVGDPAPEVRRRAAELTVSRPQLAGLPIALLADGDGRAVEAACFALGELAEAVRGGPAVAALSSVATGHRDPLCREAAVAALGAIGDRDGLPAILSATTDRPAVRRRAVLALAPFDGPEVETALQAALGDRDWQVRQAAEDLTAP